MRFHYFGILPCLFLLTGCFATTSEYAHRQAVSMCGGPIPAYKTVWMFYDECAPTTTGFPELAECGKARRNEDCSKDNSCSPEGNAMVAYAENLADMVRAGKISSKKAYQSWEGYKTKEKKNYEKIMTRANSDEVRQCYQRAYPQFYQTEVQRRSAIDTSLASSTSSPSASRMINCHSTGVGGNMTCF